MIFWIFRSLWSGCEEWRIVMHKPTEIEKDYCLRIVKDILQINTNSICEKYVDEIFRTAYAIGGDYSEKTLRSIAEILLKDA